MIIQKQEIIIDHADKLSGTALCRKDFCSAIEDEVQGYSIYGIIYNKLSNELIEKIGANIGNFVEKCTSYSKNEKIQNRSKGIGYISGEGTKMGLCFIKNVALSKDKMLQLEGIIKLMRYCTDEQIDSFIQDVTVSEIIAALPIDNERAYTIYTGEPIQTLEEIWRIYYSKDELENIGYLLYFMVRAKCTLEEVKRQVNLMKVLSAIGMQNKISDYEMQYRNNGNKKMYQIYEACSAFQNLKENKVTIDFKYFSKVIKKLSYYTLADCGIHRQGLVIPSRGIDAIIEKDINLGINVVGEAIALAQDIRKSKKQVNDIQDECHKCLVAQGVEGNFISSKIIPAADEICNYYNDMKRGM